MLGWSNTCPVYFWRIPLMAHTLCLLAANSSHWLHGCWSDSSDCGDRLWLGYFEWVSSCLYGLRAVENPQLLQTLYRSKVLNNNKEVKALLGQAIFSFNSGRLWAIATPAIGGNLWRLSAWHQHFSDQWIRPLDRMAIPGDLFNILNKSRTVGGGRRLYG